MTNEFVRLVYRGIIKKNIGSLLDLLAKLCKAFNNNFCINFSFNDIRKQCIVTIQEAQDIYALVMRRCWHFNRRAYGLPCIRDTRS